MTDLYLAAERDKPEIDFRYSRHHLAIRGESYPENATAFYAPVLDSLAAYLGSTRDADITVDVDLLYFNSSSTKILLTLFETLDAATSQGNRIHVYWHHDPDDDTALDFGNDIASDFISLNYQAVAKV